MFQIMKKKGSVNGYENNGTRISIIIKLEIIVGLMKAHKSIKWWIKNQFADSAKYFEEMSAQVVIKIWRLLKSR